VTNKQMKTPEDFSPGVKPDPPNALVWPLPSIPNPGASPIELLIAEFERLWPTAFAVYEARRKPLRIGIHREVIAALAGKVPEEEVRHALRIYVANTAYMRGLRAGRARVGLDGEKAGEVTAEEEEHAHVAIKSKMPDDEGWRRAQLCSLPPRERREQEELQARHALSDPDGSWARNPHPANANKPLLTLTLMSGRAR
jgi:sRNA-binding protein